MSDKLTILISPHFLCPCGEIAKFRSIAEIGRKQFCSKKCRYELDNFKIPHKFKEAHPNWYLKGSVPWTTGKGKPRFDSYKGYMTIGINRKYKLYHRYVMELHLGRELSSQEVVHHIDGNKLNNHISNLQLMASKSEHLRHHWAIRKASV